MSHESRYQTVDFFEVWHHAYRDLPMPAYVEQWATKSEANRSFLEFAARTVRIGNVQGADLIGRIVTAIKADAPTAYNVGSESSGWSVNSHAVTCPEVRLDVRVSAEAIASHEAKRVERARQAVAVLGRAGGPEWERIAKELGV